MTSSLSGNSDFTTPLKTFPFTSGRQSCGNEGPLRDDERGSGGGDDDGDEQAMDISETNKCYVYGQCQVSRKNSLIFQK